MSFCALPSAKQPPPIGKIFVPSFFNSCNSVDYDIWLYVRLLPTFEAVQLQICWLLARKLAYMNNYWYLSWKLEFLVEIVLRQLSTWTHWDKEGLNMWYRDMSVMIWLISTKQFISIMCRTSKNPEHSYQQWQRSIWRVHNYSSPLVLKGNPPFIQASDSVRNLINISLYARLFWFRRNVLRWPTEQTEAQKKLVRIALLLFPNGTN